MKKLLFVVAGLAFAITPAIAQDFYPVEDPTTVGVTPLTSTTVLTEDLYHTDDNLESLGIDITSDGKVIIGWEDDSVEVGAGIRAYDLSLNNLPWASDFEDNNVSSYYFDDGAPTDDNSGWGPKVRANYFGDGFGMGSSAWGFPENSGRLVDSLADLMEDDEGRGPDSPCVQLYQADMTPIVPIICGITDEFAQPVGSVRIADWCYLSNGSYAFMNESRQKDANVTAPMNMSAVENGVAVSVVLPGQQFGSNISRVLEYDGKAESWHGIAPLANGFACRVAADTIKMRIFDNDGNPVTGDIDMADYTFVDGEGVNVGAVLNNGGRGDGMGFDSNANDRIVITGKTDVDGITGTEVYAAAFDASGNLVVGPILVSDGFADINCDRVDCAVGPDGSFIIVFDDDYALFGDRLLMARIFNADGTPATDIFSVDDRFSGDAQEGQARRGRVAWRGNKIAVAWESTNSWPGGNGPNLLTARVFEYGEAGVEDYMLH